MAKKTKSEKPLKKQIDKKPLSKKLHTKFLPSPLPEKTLRSITCPSKYNPEMCDKLIISLAQGKSFNTACVEMGINPDTGYEWVKKDGDYYKPEFAEARAWGLALSERWWTEIGRLNLCNHLFNNTLFMMYMQNMHGWTRKVEGKIESKHIEEIIETKKIEINFNEEYAANVIKILSDSKAFEDTGESSSDE